MEIDNDLLYIALTQLAKSPPSNHYLYHHLNQNSPCWINDLQEVVIKAMNIFLVTERVHLLLNSQSIIDHNAAESVVKEIIGSIEKSEMYLTCISEKRMMIKFFLKSW